MTRGGRVAPFPADMMIQKRSGKYFVCPVAVEEGASTEENLTTIQAVGAFLMGGGT